jgi:hypothetical protein
MMGSELMYYIPVLGVIGLVVMIGKAMWVSRQDAGEKNMQELAGYIARGASAFLKAEWRVLGIYVAIAAGLLAWSSRLAAVKEHTDWLVAVAFVIGAFFSALRRLDRDEHRNARQRPYHAGSPHQSLARASRELQWWHGHGPRRGRTRGAGLSTFFIVFYACTSDGGRPATSMRMPRSAGGLLAGR